MFNPRHSSITPEQSSTAPGRSGRSGLRAVTVVALLVSAALAFTGQPVNAAPQSAQRVQSRAIAHNDQGKLTSKIVGRTSTGQKVTGTFTPLHAVTRNGQVMVKGVVQGVIHQTSGHTSTFTAVRKVPVRSLNGQPVTGRAAAAAVSGRATCDILHLVLGPLDLDLLGLQVHLNRVILDIVAVTGAGNLLGNLLCAITGILDGGPLGGLLGQLSDLLNQILAALQLGV